MAAARKKADKPGDSTLIGPAHTSLWEATAEPPRGWPALAGAQKAHVAIVGGGYTGLSAALHVAAAGFDPIVLDQQAPGWGASGRNGGQVISGLKYDPDELIRRLGKRMGLAVIATAGAAPDLVFDLIDRYGIACDATRAGWLQLAVTPATLRAVRSRAQQWQAQGAPVAVLDRDTAQRLSGSNLYLGGLLDQRGGSVQPLRYARGLAIAAEAQGVRIFARTPVTRVSRTHYGWYVETPEGSVAARTVIIATNATTDTLWDGLQRSIVTMPSVQIATDPLPEHLRRDILPEGHVVSDTRRLLRYFRLDGEGRLIMGARGVFSRAKDASAVRHHLGAVHEIYPQLAGIEFPYQWGGMVAMTTDHMPHLHELAPALITGLGYNGRGVAMATMMGRILARWATGTPREELGFPITSMKPMEFPEIADLGARLTVQYLRFRDALDR